MSFYHIEVFSVGAFQSNCSILIHAQDKRVMVIDPGGDSEVILSKLDSYGLGLAAIWHTHAHLDHIGATQAVYGAFLERNKVKGLPPPRVYLHPEDKKLYESVPLQSQMLGMDAFEVPKVSDWIKSGQEYEDFPGLKAIHTPGHSPGGCCLLISESCDLFAPKDFGELNNREQQSPVLIGGDTLFRRSIGRTDLWGGSFELLEKSIKTKLYSLDGETLVVPGHGPLTRIGEEREKNSFVTA